MKLNLHQMKLMYQMKLFTTNETQFAPNETQFAPNKRR